MALASALASYYRLQRMWRVAARFGGWTPQLSRREVHRFMDQEEVEVVAR